MENAKEAYGEDFTIVYKIDKETKMSKDDLRSLNQKMKESISDSVDATECYEYEGTVTLKGSKNSTQATMSTIARCNYNGSWYLIKK